MQRLFLSGEIHGDDVRSIVDRLGRRRIIFSLIMLGGWITIFDLRLELQGEVYRRIDECGDGGKRDNQMCRHLVERQPNLESVFADL